MPHVLYEIVSLPPPGGYVFALVCLLAKAVTARRTAIAALEALVPTDKCVPNLIRAAALDGLVPTDKCVPALIKAAVLDGLVPTDKP